MEQMDGSPVEQRTVGNLEDPINKLLLELLQATTHGSLVASGFLLTLTVPLLIFSNSFVEDEASWVNSPKFNFTGFTSEPIIILKLWWEIETTYDGAALQISGAN